MSQHDDELENDDFDDFDAIVADLDLDLAEELEEMREVRKTFPVVAFKSLGPWERTLGVTTRTIGEKNLLALVGVDFDEEVEVGLFLDVRQTRVLAALLLDISDGMDTDSD